MNSNSPKILINCLSARSGGAVSYLRNAISRILNASHEQTGVEFMALCDAHQSQLIEADHKNLILADTQDLGGFKRSYWERRNLPKIVQQHEFSVVFTPYQVASARTAARSVLMLRNMEPFFFDGYCYSAKTRLRNHLLRISTVRCTKAADHVIAVSDFARDHLVNQVGVPARQVSRVYHGRDPYFSENVEQNIADTVLAEMKIQRPFLLTCGSLLPYRRCEDVIWAFQRFCQTDDRPIDLVIAGDGNDPRYRNKLHDLANQSELADRILFVGHVGKDQIRTLYQRAELVILATEIEACPNIAIEAMSASAAIVAGDCQPLLEIIGRDNASFFEKRNVGQLSQRIGQSLDSPQTIAQMRQRARQRAEDFSWQTCTSKTIQLLASIPGNG